MKTQLQKLFAFLVLITGLSTNTKAQWQIVGTAGFSAGIANRTSLKFSNAGQPFVAFKDGANSSKATVMKFDGANWLTVGTAGFSAAISNIDESSLPFAFSSNDEPYVAFIDNASIKANVMKYNGISWVNVGAPGFSSGNAADICLAFNSAGVAHVAFADYTYFGKITVMKFDGTNWINVGNAGFTAGIAQYLSLAFSNSGAPYVAFNNAGSNVMMFDGTNWVTVGNAGFSATSVMDNCLVFSNSDEPYLAFRSMSGMGKASVMKYNGTNWVNVGSADFSDGLIRGISLAFSNNNEPYVVYKDWGNAQKAVLKKFDGTAWVNVGLVGFTSGTADFTSLAFQNGEPYVAFEDGTVAYKATLMKFVENTAIKDNAALTKKINLNPNPAFDVIKITNNSNIDLIDYEIYNITGAVVAKQRLLQSSTEIEINNFSNGIYTIKFYSPSEIIAVQKFNVIH